MASLNCFNPIHTNGSGGRIKVCPECGAFLAEEQARNAEKAVADIPDDSFTYYRKSAGAGIGYFLLFLAMVSGSVYLLFLFLFAPGGWNEFVMMPAIGLGFFISFFCLRAAFRAFTFKLGIHHRAIIWNKIRIPNENIKMVSTETASSRQSTSTAVYFHFRNSDVKGSIRVPKTTTGYKKILEHLQNCFPQHDLQKENEIKPVIFCPYCGMELDAEKMKETNCSYCSRDLQEALTGMSNKTRHIKTGNQAGFYVVLFMSIGVVLALILMAGEMTYTIGTVKYIIVVGFVSFLLLFITATAWRLSCGENTIMRYIDIMGMERYSD